MINSIQEWATASGGADLVWKRGELRGYEAADGTRAIETNGDTLFSECVDNFDALWDARSLRTTITVWEEAADWGDVSEDERIDLDAEYESECYARLCEAFPHADIDHTVSRYTSGDRRVSGADYATVCEILDGVWESMCAKEVA